VTHASPDASKAFASITSAVIFALCTIVSPPANANPRPLPFSYPHQTLPKGALEIEQYADLVPVHIAREYDAGTQAVLSLRSALQTELEYGVTDWAEVAWYFVFRQAASATPYLRFQGVKQRVRFRLADEGAWPVNVGLYLEMAEFHDELEFEEKILLSRRLGRFNLVTNLWVEQEYYFQLNAFRFIFNPTLGATFEISPNVIVGAEYWVRGRFDREAQPPPDGGATDSTAAHHYLGPTLLLQSGKVWFSVGAYARLDGIGAPPVVADPWGKAWIRTLIGIEL
jgi:hypothetical protein